MGYCEKCGGQGQVICLMCDGTGKIKESGYTHVCRLCAGSGLVECDECLGSGDDEDDR